jgi:hypothetical protein
MPARISLFPIKAHVEGENVLAKRLGGFDLEEDTKIVIVFVIQGYNKRKLLKNSHGNESRIPSLQLMLCAS